MGFYSSGCFYEKYESTAYQCHSFPSGGTYEKLSDEYLEYQKYYDERKQEQERINEENMRDNFFRNFDPFGNFGRREMPEFFEEMEEQEQIDYPFSVFGLKKSASQEDMKKAYHKSARETHPDKTGENTEDEFREVQEAYEYYQTFYI